jgi:hypothetical protein
LLASPFFTLLRLGAQAWGALRRRGAAGRFASDHSPLALLAVLLRAYGAALAGAPAMLRKRRAVQAARRVSAWAAVGWLRRYGMGVRAVAWTE